MSGRLVSVVFASGLSPDLKFTAAVLASFADDAGFRIWPSMGEVAHLRGVTERAVQYHVKELRRMTVLEVVKPATQWRPAHYRLVVEHLPARASYQPPEREQFELGSEGAGVKPTSPLNLGVNSTSPLPGVKPTSFRGEAHFTRSVIDPSVRTHTDARARAGDDDEPATLPIVAIVRDPGHVAHAFCGRVCVPKFLHKEFKRALGGPVMRRPARVRSFYVDTLASWPAARPIGDEPLKFWRAAFAVAFGSAAPAPVVRRREAGIRGWSCQHDPRCSTSAGCIARTIADGREANDREWGT